MKLTWSTGGTAIAITFLLGSAVLAAPPAAPVTLIKTVALPDIGGGDFDHFAVDLKRNRLYVSAEAHHSIEVFNLATGEHLLSGGPVATPHALALNLDKNQLFVADGGDSSVKVLNASDLRFIKRIDTKADPDAGIYDPKTRLFYVGNGGRGEKANFSMISIISIDDASVHGEIRVDSTTIKSLQIDHITNRLFASLRDKKQVAVVDLTKNAVTQVWSAPGLNQNTPIAFDAKDHRLFIGSRSPGKLFVLNSDTGATVGTFNCTNIADDMSYDDRTRRVYVSAAEGLTVFQQDDADHYHEIGRVDTKGGKTSVLVPGLNRLYIPHTKLSAPEAGLEIYQVKG
jgi:DNA-binding beta-propeller fold protein YncE